MRHNTRLLTAAAAMMSLVRTASSTSAAARSSPLPPVRAVALDLDGTLCNSQGYVTERTIAALARFVSEGGRAYIATGRNRHHSVGFAEALAERGVHIAAIVTNDGGLVLSSSSSSAWDDVVFCGMPRGDDLAPVIDRLLATEGPRDEVNGGGEKVSLSFAASLEESGSLLVSDASYIDAIRRHNPSFFEKMMSGNVPPPRESSFASTSGGGGGMIRSKLVVRPKAVPSEDFLSELRVRSCASTHSRDCCTVSAPLCGSQLIHHSIQAAPRVAWVRCLDHSPGATQEPLKDRLHAACSAEFAASVEEEEEEEEEEEGAHSCLSSPPSSSTPSTLYRRPSLCVSPSTLKFADVEGSTTPVAVTIRSVDDDVSGAIAISRQILTCPYILSLFC